MILPPMLKLKVTSRYSIIQYYRPSNKYVIIPKIAKCNRKLNLLAFSIKNIIEK